MGRKKKQVKPDNRIKADKKEETVNFSPIGWELELTVKDKKQLVPFINYLISRDFVFTFTYGEEFDGSHYVYRLTIENGCWSSNLIEIAEFLNKHCCNKNYEEIK